MKFRSAFALVNLVSALSLGAEATMVPALPQGSDYAGFKNLAQLLADNARADLAGKPALLKISGAFNSDSPSARQRLAIATTIPSGSGRNPVRPAPS
jgi:hypothetical protein